MFKFQSCIAGACLVAVLLAGCSSSGPVKEQEPAPVADAELSTPKPMASKQPIQVVQTPITAATIPATPVSSDANATKNPNNILFKRVIYFDYDSNIVKEEFRPLVAAHAKYISTTGSAKMIVQGNTDERGGREYNLALGQRRADAVRQMMTVLGAEGTRVESVSFGKEKPAMQGATEEAFAKNRRAEIVYNTD